MTSGSKIKRFFVDILDGHVITIDWFCQQERNIGIYIDFNFVQEA